jgi:hypothetical protein
MPLSSTYIPNVPQGNQQINNTQPPIEGNFQDIAELLAINHIPFNTTDTFGRHSIVDYVNQGVDPSTSSTEMALYSKSVTNDPNLAELFYRYPSNGSVVQLTGVNTTSTPTGGSGAASGGTFYQSGSIAFGQPIGGFWQYLSGGIIIMNYSISNNVGTTPQSSPYTFYFPGGTYTNGVVVPTFTQPPFNVQICAYQGQGASGQNVNYAATITNISSGLLYYNGSIPTNGAINTVLITLIGI